MKNLGNNKIALSISHYGIDRVTDIMTDYIIEGYKVILCK